MPLGDRAERTVLRVLTSRVGGAVTVIAGYAAAVFDPIEDALSSLLGRPKSADRPGATNDPKGEGAHGE